MTSRSPTRATASLADFGWAELADAGGKGAALGELVSPAWTPLFQRAEAVNRHAITVTAPARPRSL